MQLMRQSIGHVLSYKMLSSPHLASPSAVQTPPTGVSASAAKNKGMDNYKQRKYADAIKWFSWAVILLEKTCDGAASMEVLSSRASCYKEVGEYKKAVVDCTKRNYNVSLPHNKIPDALCQLAKKMAAPAMPGGEEFRPEAAIVNYFGLGDTLGGHLDDMELIRKPHFPGDKPGRMEDPTENRRGENQQLGLTMGENQQNHRVPESATNTNADGHANTKTNMMDLNMQPHQIHEQASNNQDILVVSKYY